MSDSEGSTALRVGAGLYLLALLAAGGFLFVIRSEVQATLVELEARHELDREDWAQKNVAQARLCAEAGLARAQAELAAPGAPDALAMIDGVTGQSYSGGVDFYRVELEPRGQGFALVAVGRIMAEDYQSYGGLTPRAGYRIEALLTRSDAGRWTLAREREEPLQLTTKR